MSRFLACLVLASLFFLHGARAWPQEKTPPAGKSGGDAKKVEIPVDPTPRLAYQYGQMGKFGITGLLISGKNRVTKQLTYSTDGLTNMIIVQVDDRTDPFGGPAGRFTVVPAYKGGKTGQKFFSTGAWLHQQNVAITQTLDIVPSLPAEVAPGKFKRFLDTCLITYTLENRDKKAHKVGMRLEVDTLIGTNDGVPFTVPGLRGLVDTKHDFVGADKVPDFIQALEVPDLKNPGTVAQMTLKVGRGLESPSRVSLTHWTGGFAKWDVPLEDMGADSAVILYWEPKELQPKEKRVIGFAYGLGSIATQEGGALGLTVSGALEKGVSFSAVARVTKPAPGQKLTLVLPPGLKLINGKETEPAAEPNAKGVSVVTWHVVAQKAGQFRVEVRSSDGATAAQNITIIESLLTPIPGDKK
jgi:hypothetical protein